MADAAIQTRRQFTADEIAALNARFARSGSKAMLEAVLREYQDARIALVSSFGSNSVVLLHLIATVNPALPVLFIDTGRLFGATLQYRKEIAALLGLSNVVDIRPDPAAVQARDGDGALWLRDPESCCELRKVAPFAQALAGYDIWISGRKRYQGGARAELPLFEADEPRLKINPLANWTRGDIEIYRAAFSLPQHPLAARGYASIGCEPCTSPIRPGEDERAGRWRGMGRSECGIHLAAAGGGS